MKIYIGVIGVCILLMLCVRVTSGNDLTAIYGGYIDREISLCACKSSMLTSKSDNLRLDARVSVLKAAYYSVNREDLIKEMRVLGIETKQYKVDYYLNKRFYDMLSQTYPVEIGRTLISNDYIK